jgi:orotate phosphoribosyltransferase
MESRHPELLSFIAQRAFKRGQFKLSSGGTSTYYIDGKLISFDPQGVWLTVEAILAEIRDVQFDAVGGMDMGATPIVSALALRSHELGHPIPTFTVRKEVKAHGTQKRIEGPMPPRSRVIIIDDVVTTGDSILKAIDAVQEAGCTVPLAICVVDRNAGATQTMQNRGIPYRPLIHLSELGVT